VPLRVFVVDDVQSARAGLCAFLSFAPDVEITGEAENGVQALEQISADPPDVVIMDIEMPQMDGLETTRQLRSRDIPVHILVLSVAFDRRSEALAAGADAFVHKGEPLDVLLVALEAFRPSEIKPSPSASIDPAEQDSDPQDTIFVEQPKDEPEPQAPGSEISNPKEE
jgi:DNA-binding NarL/FixJ family response regulator